MKITEFIETTRHCKNHMIQSIVLIFFEFEIKRRHNKWHILNSHMNRYYLLTVDSDSRDEILGQFDLDILIIRYT